MYSYSLYGLNIVSELKIYQLDEIDPSVTPDVSIEYGSVKPFNAEKKFIESVAYSSEGNIVLVEADRVGKFIINSGREIIIEPHPEANEDIIRDFITGFIFLFLLHLRSIITFHASAVETEKGALVIMGNKGSGKTTTAAFLAMRGYPMLCDDIVPVTRDGTVLPGIPRPKLLPDAFRKLGLSNNAVLRRWDGIAKYETEVPHSKIEVVNSIFIQLEICGTESLLIEELTGMKKLQAAQGHLQYIAGVDDPVNHFNTGTAIFNRTRFLKIKRPAGRDTLDEVLDLIENNIIKEVL